MVHSLSLGEWALIFGIVLILFGGNRIASVGKSLGEGIANFKKGLRSTEEPTREESPPTVVASHTTSLPREDTQVTSTIHVVEESKKV